MVVVGLVLGFYGAGMVGHSILLLALARTWAWNHSLGLCFSFEVFCFLYFLEVMGLRPLISHY